MPRYIDADALKHELCIRQHMLNADSLWKTLEIMDAQPTADVVERKRGKWLSHYEYCQKKGMMPSGLIAFWWCDLCEQGVEHPTNFCPSCGADMREEKADGKIH